VEGVDLAGQTLWDSNSEFHRLSADRREHPPTYKSFATTPHGNVEGLRRNGDPDQGDVLADSRVSRDSHSQSFFGGGRGLLLVLSLQVKDVLLFPSR